MTTHETLVKMRELLTPKGAWTQNAAGRDDHGSIPQDFDNAVCWCLMGAMAKVTGDLFNAPAEQILDATIALDFGRPSHQYIAWNDVPGRTQGQVLALLDRAIAAAEAR